MLNNEVLIPQNETRFSKQKAGAALKRLHNQNFSLEKKKEIDTSTLQKYWRKNLKYVKILLGIWFTVSYEFSILFVNKLDQFRFAEFKLRFWFAQQNSIYVFVVLIFIYVELMNRLDRKFDVNEK